MRKQKHKRWLSGVLSVLVGVALLTSTALAAGGSLVLNYSHRDGVSFSLYRVADIQPGGYELSGDFEDAPVSLPSGSSTNREWLDAANTLAGYAAGNHLTPAASGVITGGSLTFTGLDGLYLVVGDAYTVGSYTYTPTPFLVAVSGQTVTAQVKYDRNGGGGGDDDDDSDYANYRVVKVWKDGQGENRPNSVTIQLLRNGREYDQVELNSSNGWSHTWYSLDTSYRWQIMELDVPDGYTVSVSQSGTTFTVTNSSQSPGGPDNPGGSDDPNTPDDPDNPNVPDTPDTPDTPDVPDAPDSPDTPTEPDKPGLPQTGQLWWPVPFLAAGGAALIAISLLLRRGKKEDGT